MAIDIKSVYKLLRLRPTIAWGVCGTLLGTSVAIHEYGLVLNWGFLLISLIGVLVIQGIVAHAINDLSDEEVDKITDISGTGRFKVLISGIMKREDLIFLSVMAMSLVAAIISFLVSELGYLILVFASIGIYAPLAYSLPPLKLGWRPFSEWTVVFPALVALVVGVNFVATSSLSFNAFLVGVVFALFNILWFIVSRIVDIVPDNKMNKVTTPVYLERKESMLYSLFQANSYIYLFTMLMFTYIFSVFLSFYQRQLWFLTIAIVSVLYLIVLLDFNMSLPDKRKTGIYLSIASSVVMSVMISLS